MPPPADGDAVVLDGLAPAGQKGLTWDIAGVRLSSWMQTGYTNVVTIATRYPGQGTFTSLQIVGDCVISNGGWTHPANSGGGLEADRLAVAVGGHLILETDAWVNANQKGYAALAGPSAGTGGQSGTGAGHGGMAAIRTMATL